LAKRTGHTLPVVVEALLLLLFGNIINQSFVVLAPFIKDRFLLNAGELSYLPTAVYAGVILILLLSGIFIDRLGNRTAIKLSFLFMALGLAACVAASSYYVLLIGYFLIGLGYGSLPAATNSTVISAYRPSHYKKMGLKQTGIPVGVLFAIIFLPIIALDYGLVYAFIFMLVIAVLVFALMGHDRGKPKSESETDYLHELLSVLKNKTVYRISALSAFLFWAQQSVATYLVLFFIYNGFGIFAAEIALFALILGSIAGRNIWPSIGTRAFGSDKATSLSAVAAGSALLIIILAMLPGDFVVAIAISFILGIFIMGWSSIYNTIISESAGEGRVGVHSGVGFIILDAGIILGLPVSGFLIHAFSYRYTFDIIGVVLLIISAAIFVFGRDLAGSAAQRHAAINSNS